MGTLISLIVVATSVWVYLDATKHKIGAVKEVKEHFVGSAGAWATITLLLWIIGFPAYLIKRGKLIERAKQHPVEVKGRGLKTAALVLLGGIWALMIFVAEFGYKANMENYIFPLPNCESEEAIATLEEIALGWVEANEVAAKFVALKAIQEQGFNATTQVRACQGVLVTTLGEDRLQYSIIWQDQQKYLFEVEARLQ